MVKRFLSIGVFGVLAILAACNSSDSSGDCTTLQTCCSQLTDASNKSECTQVVEMQDVTSCQQAQTDFVGASLCVVSTSSSSSSATGCVGLTTCCASISESSQQTACLELVGDGDDGSCTTALDSYVSSGVCKGPTVTTTTVTGCAGLTSCCGTLSSEEQPGCESLVTSANGDDTTCTSFLTAAYPQCASGTGTGVGTGSGTGTGGTGCSELQSCCDTLSGAEQTECNEVVTEGVDCTAEADAFCSTGTGSGTGTGTADCSSLSSCCGTLESAEQTACQEVVSEGNAAECSEEQAALCP